MFIIDLGCIVFANMLNEEEECCVTVVGKLREREKL